MSYKRRVRRPRFPARPPKKRFPFLSLPWEIRDRILRELLYSPTPLRYSEPESAKDKVCRDYKMHPEILRTCSQLYEEGRAVLWGANTIAVDLCLRLQGEGHWSVAGIPQPSSDGGKLLLRRVRSIFDETTKLHIFLDFSCYDQLEGKWGPDPQHTLIRVWPIHKICERLLRKTNLKDCHIEITGIGVVFEKLGSKITSRNIILKAFELLRCGTAVINGVPASSAVALTETMMIREPAWDLFRMKAALDKFIRGECCCGDCASRYPCAEQQVCCMACDRVRRIEICVTNCDVAGFLTERAEILRTIEDCRAQRKRKVFESDQHTASEVFQTQYGHVADGD